MTNDLSTGLLGRPHLCQPVGPARRAGGPKPNPPKPPAGSGCSVRTMIDLLWQLMLFQLGYIGTAFPRIPLPVWLERVPRPNSNVCVRARASPHQLAILGLQQGSREFSLILTPSTRRQNQIPQVKGSVLQVCPLLQTPTASPSCHLCF